MCLECSNLKVIELPEGTQAIQKGCFRKTGIIEITIPKSVKTIEESAFQECKDLQAVVFENGSELETMKEYVFQGCSSLKNIRLPDKLNAIGSCCFKQAGIQEIRFTK